MRTTSLYHRASPESWKGRVDSLEDRDAFRLHQVVECLDLEQEPPKVLPPGFVGFGLLGYCGDQGVQQNLGRPGAAQGPMSIRQELANLPCTFDANTHLYDAGDVVVDEEPMERGQHALGLMVSRMLGAHLFPILLGGGHELALGHYRGIREWLGQPGRRSPPKLGIINFDAHLDLRPHDQGASSGTMFSQIAELCERAGDGFSYCCVGAQMYGNTTSLFRKARSLNSLTLLAREINETGTQEALKTVLNFAGQHDYLYVTLCADVFSSAFAPGVSAPQPFGLSPETVLQLLKPVLRTGKALGFDIAEVSPRFDHDNCTAKLAAIVVFAVVNTLNDCFSSRPDAPGSAGPFAESENRRFV